MCIVHVIAFLNIFQCRVRVDPFSEMSMDHGIIYKYCIVTTPHRSLVVRISFVLPVTSNNTHITMYVRSVGMDFFVIIIIIITIVLLAGNKRYPERPRPSRTRETYCCVCVSATSKEMLVFFINFLREAVRKTRIHTHVKLVFYIDEDVICLPCVDSV